MVCGWFEDSCGCPPLTAAGVVRPDSATTTAGVAHMDTPGAKSGSIPRLPADRQGRVARVGAGAHSKALRARSGRGAGMEGCALQLADQQ
jgi:hypothetical protein